MRARWMDPNTGRFLSRDPVPANPLHLTSFNRYAYAEGCPSTFTDPNGTDVRCTQGIYRLAQLLDIHADVYVGGRNNYDNVHDFVEAIARKFAGINDLAGIEAAVATGNQPQTAPTEIDSVGWNPDFVDEKYPGQHLIAFVAYGFYKHNLSGTLAASAQEIAAGSLGTLQDKLLGDVGYELGSGLYRGALGGYAGEDAYLRSVPSLNARDLGGEIIRRLGSGRCQTGFKGDYQKIPYPAI
ncbi:MAG: hypothetical protein DCC49_13000 [Acidobacteria bacterium]|nr:MAG: hypothetical protein DCC49_13000 [Acidobacteriota bacterium]